MTSPLDTQALHGCRRLVVPYVKRKGIASVVMLWLS